jgi:toxin CptA
MSIAVSAVVRPSFCLLLLLAGLASLLVGAGALLLGTGFGRHAAAWPAAAASAGAGLVLFRAGLLRWRRNVNGWRIDISGVGQIRLTVYQSMHGAAPVAADAGTVTLMAGSTLWSGLLLLRLRGARETAQGGPDEVMHAVVHELLVWPGNVAGQAFRPLSLACRVIATHNNHTAGF